MSAGRPRPASCEDAHAIRHGHWSPLEIDLIEESIHLPGGNALAPLVRDFLHQLHYPLDVLALSCRDENYWRIGEILEHVTQLSFEDVAIGRWFPICSSGGDQ